MNDQRQRWMFLWLSAITMSVGWGMRGVMGHSRGAMIPGVLIALVAICLLPGKRFSHSLLVGLGALAYGFAATMTTQDTCDIALGWDSGPHTPVSRAWLGLVLKGAIWAAYGGIYLGMGLVAERFRRWEILAAMVLMVLAFPVGWTLIDKPSPLYFGITRYESFGGFIFCIVALLVWLTLRGRTRVPLLLGAYAALGGAVGLPAGAAVGYLGIHTLHNGPWYDWWKSLELTFGACMGIGLGLGLYRVRGLIPDSAPGDTEKLPSLPPLVSVLIGVGLCLVFMFWPEDQLGEWLIFGSLLTCAVFFYRSIGWHLALTVPFYATAVNVAVYWLHEQKIGSPWFLWTMVGLITLGTASLVARYASQSERTARRFFLLFLWGIVIFCGLKDGINHRVLYPAAGAVAATSNRLLYDILSCSNGWADQTIFILMSIALTAGIASKYSRATADKAFTSESEPRHSSGGSAA